MRCAGQSYFSQIEAKKRLVEAIIQTRESLLSLEEVGANPDLRAKVKTSIAKAHFNKAYLALSKGQEFPWKSYFASCATGVSWRHFSMGLRAVKSQVSRALNPILK